MNIWKQLKNYFQLEKTTQGKGQIRMWLWNNAMNILILVRHKMMYTRPLKKMGAFSSVQTTDHLNELYLQIIEPRQCRISGESENFP